MFNSNLSEKSQLKEWFQVLEVEVNSRCNLRCSYCPQRDELFQPLEKLMPVALFQRIIDMAESIQFAGRLSFHHYNEPLLRYDLECLVKYARRQLPLAFLELYTNGTLLDNQRYEKLLFSGVDRFFITNHNYLSIPQRSFQKIKLPGDFYLSGRGGIIDQTDNSWEVPCYAPTEMLIVRHNGDVVLCHEDALSHSKMGNLETDSIEQIWFSERFKNIRRDLKYGKRSKVGGICTLCDNRLHLLPDTAI